MNSEKLYELYTLAYNRRKLDSAEIEELEAALKSAPDDLSIRVQLLGHYQCHESESDKCLQHLLWYIENNFEGQILAQVGVARCNSAHVNALKEAWLKVIESDPKNVVLLKKAIEFFKRFSEVENEFTERACDVEPDNENWPRDLSAWYLYKMTQVPSAEAQDYARKAIDFGKEALDRHKRLPRPCYLRSNLNSFLEELTAASLRFNWLDDANYLGNYLVEFGQKEQTDDDEDARESVYRVHLGHSIQGRAALQKNDIELALMHLKKMPLFVDMDFEYDLLFAKALLEKGHKSAVCAYLDDCRNNLSSTLDHTVPGDPVYVRALERCARRNSEIDYPIRRAQEIIEQIDEWITEIYAGEEVEFPTYLVRDFRMKDLGIPHFKLTRVGPDEVPKLLKKLQKDPNDLHARLELLNYYMREDTDGVLEHLFWLIDNKPEIDFKHYNIWLGAKHVDEVEPAWTKAIEKDPNNPIVVRNAIFCCGMHTKESHQRWLEHGYKIDPSNEEWPRKLSFHYYLGTVEKSVEEAKPNALKSIQFGKEAIELYKQFPNDGQFSIREECKRHAQLCLHFDWLDDAKYFGEYLVEHGHAQQRTWDGDDVSLLLHVSAVHLGHSILGRVALRRNDIEQVLTHLARMQFYNHLDFYPEMEFAQELLESGRTETVCSYLDDCIQHFSRILELMIEEGPFYQAVLQDRDMPIDGPGYLLDNLRRRISKLEKWKTLVRDGKQVALSEYIYTSVDD